jgi:hypothetical protein
VAVIYKHEKIAKLKIRHPYLQLVTWGGWRRWHSNLEHSYRTTAGSTSNRLLWSFRWKLILKRTIWRYAKIISKMKYILKLVWACKGAHLVCCRERPADECGANKVPDGQEHSYCRVAHRQPSTADAARQMRPAHSSWSCGSSIPAQCKSFATSRFITPDSAHLVRGSDFVSETVYPGRFNGITQVIQIAYKRTVHYKQTYTHTNVVCVNTYIHSIFHFHQTLEQIVTRYQARHKNKSDYRHVGQNLTEDSTLH